MWIARDKNGLLHLHDKKPIKTIYGWYNPGWIATLPSYKFPIINVIFVSCFNFI